ncbi:UNVERIFIED_CONTAM: hypothetical protein K2H54_061237 [Gekko kuhli]
MSAAKVDNQCQTAARIVTDLCRKKTLPRLDLDTCKEFLFFSPDLSVPEPDVCCQGVRAHKKPVENSNFCRESYKTRTGKGERSVMQGSERGKCASWH